MEILNLYIAKKMKQLAGTNETFKDLFEIIHNQDNRVFSETTDGYSINKTSYNEVKEKSIKSAIYFKDILKDVEKESYVGLLMENSLTFVTSFWGLLMSGYKPILLNKRLSNKLNEDVIKMTNLKYIVTDSVTDLSVKYSIVDCNEIDKIEIKDVDFNWCNEIALTTSATSLNVKVCTYDGKAICNQIKNTKKIVKKNSLIKGRYKWEMKLLAFLPFYHIFGLVATYFWFAFYGRTFVFLKDYSTDTILKTVRKHKVTHLFAVPMLWHGVYKEVTKQVSNTDKKTQEKFKKGIKISLAIQNVFPRLGRIIASKLFKEVQNKIFGNSIRFMITGGGYISKDAMELINALGYPLYNGYGMTEIGISSVELSKKAKKRIQATIGKPFDSIEYKIEDNTLKVRGKSLANKIITKDEVIEVDHNEWFNTMDNVSKNSDGTYMINGRNDDVVVSVSGEKINPDLIEKEIFLPHSIRHCVMGLSYQNKTELSLIVEISENNSLLNANNLIEEIDNALIKLEKMNYHIEKIYFTYQPIAAASAIKVSRSILNKYIENGIVELFEYSKLKEMANVASFEIVDEIAMQIKKIMADILDIDITKINLKSHYIFDLGGTSLDYISLLIKLREKFGIEFNVSDDSSLYNVEAFAQYIVRKNEVNK